ncbi:nuclear protein 96-domain-containing protein [Cristinia sonorae]|uniref:Nuclear protein 96-domain-containing protein n=1 Tax=Cristinia sonorae TaxID=1940300 RepID=A0A8K0URQ9_9AGAR|nr:nuclear protein 96-domain-containing protein [Cristinia sonorae]
MARFRAYDSETEDEHASGSENGEVEPKVQQVPIPAPVAQSHGPYRADESQDEDMGVEGEVEEEEEEEESQQGEVTDEDDSESDYRASPPRKVGDPSVIPWARDVGVDSQRMHVMQSALFRVPEEARAMREVEQQTKAQPRKKLVFPKTLSRKHSRDSDGEGLRAESLQRKSFGHDIEPLPYRPSRKYARVGNAASAVSGNENALVDAGLSMGRSFRVGWGPGGTLAHLARLCGPLDSPPETANSSTVTLTTVPIFATSEAEAMDRATKLLSHHLGQKNRSPTIIIDADGVPFANPSSDLTFGSFAALFPTTDTSFEASLFRLGKALFDPLDLRLPEELSSDVRARVLNLHRKAALSEWLQTYVASSVDADLRNNPGSEWPATVFTYLTGNQIAKACDAAIDAGNVRLATLLSQCPGDADFKEDLRTQLALWRDQRVDAHISEDVRKIYSLLAGNVGVLEGSKGTGAEQCPDLPISKGLDWKRSFGLQLWFGQSMDTSIADVFAAFQDSLEDHGSSPVPWYNEGKGSTSAWKTPQGAKTPDLLYSLIRLYADPDLSLSDILHPFSYGASPLDHRLAWHLYIILSRCLRTRDLEDREDPGASDGPDAGEEVEGHSPSADLLANSYAMQLERLGFIQEAAFVLLHIEGSAGRRKVIKELLARSASKIDDYMLKGLCGSLRIPESWVNEAKATYALDQGDVYGAFEHYLKAGLFNAAHDLAVLQLAPDAVIRRDMALLTDIFQRFSGLIVYEWSVRGKIFLDYAHAMTRLPELRELHRSDAVQDASHAVEIEEFSRSIPKLLAILPDVLPDRTDVRHKVAASEMLSGLTSRLDQLRPSSIQAQIRHPDATEGTRLRHVHAASLHRFLRMVEAV